MTQTKLSIFLNEIFKYVVLFLIFFVWVNYYYPDFLMSMLIAVILASGVSFVFSSLMYKKQEQALQTKQEKSKIKQCNYNFLFASLDENLNLFNDVFKAKGIPTKVLKSYLILFPNSLSKTLFIPHYSTAGVDESVIITAYKIAQENKIYKIIICSHQITASAKVLASSIKDYNFALYNDSEVYTCFLKPHNIYPQNIVEFNKSKKLDYKTFFDMLTDKKNSKSYFYGGVMLLFASLFIGLGLYYTIFSTILFLLSLVSFYKPLASKKTEQNIFK